MAKYTSSQRKRAVKKGIKSATKSAKKRGGGKFKYVIIALIIASAVLFYLHDQGKITLPEWLAGEPSKALDDGLVQVHFIDVGQGDCSLIVADDGSTMLIDCGEYDRSADVLGYIEDLGIKRLDYVVATHPHSDHIGGMADIISSELEIGTFIMPRLPDERVPTTRVYEKMLEALANKGCSVQFARPGTVDFGAGKLSFYTADYSGDNLNNYSVVVRYSVGDSAFLFSGDLEADMERSILNSGYNISANVYKLGHHGSSTSNSALWMAAIDPEYCVCECGAQNSYGHPHSETVARVADYTDILLRTDINGSIVFETDGVNISYKCSK